MANTYRIFYAHRPTECIAMMTGEDRLEAVHKFIGYTSTRTLREFKAVHGRYPDLDKDFIVERRVPIGLGENDWPRCGVRWVTA